MVILSPYRSVLGYPPDTEVFCLEMLGVGRSIEESETERHHWLSSDKETERTVEPSTLSRSQLYLKGVPIILKDLLCVLFCAAAALVCEAQEQQVGGSIFARYVKNGRNYALVAEEVRFHHIQISDKQLYTSYQKSHYVGLTVIRGTWTGITWHVVIEE